MIGQYEFVYEAPGEHRLPVAIVDGWPEPVGEVYASEAGILLGEVMLPGLVPFLVDAESVIAAMTDVADTPVEVPLAARTGLEELRTWILATFRRGGRLLLVDPTARWWVVNDMDLELALISGPSEFISAVTIDIEPEEPFGWLPDPSRGEDVIARYELRET